MVRKMTEMENATIIDRLNTAQYYYDKGFTIIPVKSNEKKAHSYKWTDKNREILFTETINNIKQYNANYALRCDNFVCIDVDAKPKNETRAKPIIFNDISYDMYQFADKMRAYNTFQQSSVSGNPHIFFLYDDRMKHWAKKTINGFVDILITNSCCVLGAKSCIDDKEYSIHKNIDMIRMPDDLFNYIDTFMNFKNQKSIIANSLIKQILNNDDINLATSLFEILDVKRVDNYDDWIKVGCLAYSIFDEDGLSLWDTLSKKSLSYKSGCCEKAWKSFNRKNYTLATLHKWANEDNHNQYIIITDNSISKLIDRASGTKGADYDVSLIVYQLKRNVLIYTESETWYEYLHKEHKWVKLDDNVELKKYIHTELCKLFLERSTYWNKQSILHQDNEESYMTKSKNCLEIAMKLKKAGYVDSIFKCCKCLFINREFIKDLDKNNYLIGFTNGVYDLQNKQFRDGSPNDLITCNTGYDYIEFDKNNTDMVNARIKIIKFINDIMPNNEVVSFIMKRLAYLLTGDMCLQNDNLMFWIGSGGNGKGVLKNLLVATLGDYAYECEPELINQAGRKTNTPAPDLLRLKTARAVLMEEPESTEPFSIGFLKKITGEGKITARDLFSKALQTFDLQGGIVMLMNNPINFNDLDDGLNRRLLNVMFPHKFVNNPTLSHEKLIDITLNKQFTKDTMFAQIFMSMLIDTYHNDNVINGIIRPKQVIDDTNAYISNLNVVKGFINAYYETNRDFKQDDNGDVIWVKDYNYVRCDDLEKQFKCSSFHDPTIKKPRGWFKQQIINMGFKVIQISRRDFKDRNIDIFPRFGRILDEENT